MTQRPSYPSPPPGPQQRRPPSVSAPIRKKKFAGISEISEKLALNAAAVASSANTNDKSATAHSHNKGMPGPQGVNDMKTTNSRMSNRMRRKEENKEKVALSFQINGGQKIISLSQLKKHDQRIRRLQPISQKQKPRTKAAVKHIPRTAPLPSPANLAFSSTPPRTSHKFLKGNKSSTKASVFKTPLQRQRNCKFAPVVPSLVKFHNPPSSSNNADKEVHEVLTESLELVSLQEPEILRLSCSINIADQQIHIPTVSKMTKVENEIDTQADGMSPEEAPVHDDEKHLPEVQSNNNEILISDTATPIINTVTPDQPQANCANEAETNETRNLETLDDTLLTSDAHTICNELFLHGSNPKQNYKKSACAEDEHTKDTSRRVLRSNKNVFDHQQNSKGFEEKDAPQVPTRDSQLFLPPPACTCQPHGSQKVAISKKCPVHSYKLVHACKEEPEIILEAEASTTPVASSSSRVHDADKNEAKVPQEELEFLFRQVLGFCPKEFYANADTGFQDGNNTAIKMPMDLVTVFKMLQEDKIETMADLQRNLMLAFTNGIFVMNSNEHPIVKKAHSAILSLRKLFLEYATNQILHERYSQFQETGLVVLPLSEIEEQMNPKAGNRPLSPDITDLPLRRRKGKNK
ncbi:uncharacterized protein LOC118434208 [Folsomia candida]|nr:uncharacterized protein LOC118434208 [Folsomia candida]